MRALRRANRRALVNLRYEPCSIGDFHGLWHTWKDGIMLQLMNKRLDARGMVAALFLGTSLAGCAEAQARPADFPSTAHHAGAPMLAEAHDDAYLHSSSDADIDQVRMGSASAEVHDSNVAIDAPAHEAAADYDLAADQDPSAIADFQEVLAPHGAWTEDATYGLVWIPDAEVVGDDFAPYVTAGHWALTEDDEWLWVSDYEWGWAPFHYGRWVWIAGRGWAWIPGRVYAPAWVVWRTGYYDDHYVGWAPMPPTWYWRSGVAVSLWVVPPAPYVFCSTRYVFTRHVRTHIVPASRVAVVAPHTRTYYAATPTGRRSYASYVRGPSPRDVRVPARAAPRASHDSRALAFAKPVPGGRVSATASPRSQLRAAPREARQPGVLGRPAQPGLTRPMAPATPRPSAPRTVTPSPRAADSPAMRAPRQAPRIAPSQPASPRPGASPSHRVAPAPRVGPSPQRSPAPRVQPAPVRPSSTPAVRPSSPSRQVSPRANVHRGASPGAKR